MEKINLVAFEGLSFLLLPKATWVQHGLLDRLDKNKFNISVHHWASMGPKELPPGKVIAIGHSFGGGRVIDWAHRYKKKIDLMISMDPRIIAMPYEVPENVLFATNYYQLGLMRGYHVKGAKNIMINCSHVQLPFQNQIYNQIMAFR